MTAQRCPRGLWLKILCRVSIGYFEATRGYAIYFIEATRRYVIYFIPPTHNTYPRGYVSTYFSHWRGCINVERECFVPYSDQERQLKKPKIDFLLKNESLALGRGILEGISEGNVNLLFRHCYQWLFSAPHSPVDIKNRPRLFRHWIIEYIPRWEQRKPSHVKNDVFNIQICCKFKTDLIIPFRLTAFDYSFIILTRLECILSTGWTMVTWDQWNIDSQELFRRISRIS